MSLRDLLYEVEWLASTERDAGVAPGWRTRVQARLQWAQAKHGDAWRRRRVASLLQEIREEAADIPGWGVLAAQLVLADGELPEPDAVRLLGLLRQMAVYGALVDELVGQAEMVLAGR